MNRIDELKSLSPDAVRSIIMNVSSMVKSTRRYNRVPLWSIVGAAFGVGSTSAQELCKTADLNPGQIVRSSTRGLDRLPVRAVANGMDEGRRTQDSANTTDAL